MSFATHINPAVLTWAREHQGLPLFEVAAKKDFKKLQLWEDGAEKPTMNQLRSLAHFYKRPSALFFMMKPPEEEMGLTDFRSIKDHAEYPLSPETLTEIRACQSRRKNALELADILGEQVEISFPTLTLQSDIEVAAYNTRSIFDIDQQILVEMKDDKVALEYWIKKFEEQNIIVFRSHTLNGWNPSFREIRGTSNFEEEYPWILLNSQEHPRGQLFTLGHELAHLMLHSNSICSLDEDKTNSHSHIERYCNQFSAALLLPKEEIINILKTIPYSNEEVDFIINRIRKDFHASREAIARRLVSLKIIEWKDYHRVRQEQIENLISERSNRDSGGGNGKYFYKRVLSWNGYKYTYLVTEAYNQKKISLGEAVGKLRTKVNHFEAIYRELYR